MTRWTCLGGHTWEDSRPSSCCPQCNRRASAELPETGDAVNLSDRLLRVAMSGVVPADDPHVIADAQAEIERLRKPHEIVYLREVDGRPSLSKRPNPRIEEPMRLRITFTEAPIMKWSLGVKEADGYLHRRDLAPGTANIRTLDDDSTIFTFVCPCGCGAVTFVGIEKDGDVRGQSWRWNGDREKPTLAPSLQTHASCRWHGFVQDGQFVTA